MAKAKVIPFRGRKSDAGMTNPAVLQFLRDRGTTTIPTWVALADLWDGWDADRARKAVQSWAKRKIVAVIQDKTAKTITIIAPPAEWAGMPGKLSKNKPETRRRRNGKAAGKKSGKSAGAEPENQASRETGNTAAPRPESFSETVATSNTSSRSSEGNGAFPPAPPIPPITTPPTPTPSVENTSTVTQEIPPPPPPVTRHHDTISEYPSMGLFSRSKKPSDPPAKAPPKVAAEVPTGTYRAPYNVSIDGSIPTTYAEKLDWKPAPKGRAVAARGRAPGFDAANAFRHATWPERPFILIAFGLSATAAYVAVYYGMSVLFPAGNPVIMVFGGFIEAAKFFGFGVVAAGWYLYGWFSRSIVTMLLILAAVVNAAAVYGWLISSHAGPAASRTATYTQTDAGQGASIEVAQARVQDLDRRIAQIDNAIAEATRRGRTNSAMKTAEQQRRTRGQLAAERDKAQQDLSNLKAGRSVTSANHQVDEASALPIKYAAKLFEDVGLLAPGTDPEKLLRWLAFMILLCGDPLALAAMFMVNSRRRAA